VKAWSKELDGRRVFQVGRCIAQDFWIVFRAGKDSPVTQAAGESADKAGFVIVVHVEPVTPRLSTDGAHAALVVE
jgi:hypothetical protein